MLFNSWSFLIFFAGVWLLYRVLTHRRQNLLLVAASYLFYGWWDWRFLGLLLISTAVDFYCGRKLGASDDPAIRKRYLRVSLAVNLGILGFFKYFDFFVDSATAALESIGMTANLPLLEVVLPVGISFYTFQTMAYTIDVYRRKQTPTSSLLDFALYVSYFPQLVAGPIERSTRLLPQIAKPRKVSTEQIQSGLELILMGYAKKVLIADSVAPYVNRTFADPGALGSGELLLGAYFFALQIYGDFAGYTDIARGVSRLFGIELSLNFKQPYLSSNITEFWRRWHISLSSWLRDYLYIPLGGNRNGRVRTYLNNFITMVLGGLWHGASWNFVVWGALHGSYLAVHKLVLKGKRVGLTNYPTSPKEWLTLLFKAVVTFHLVCFAWIFFRADTLSDSVAYISGIFSTTLVTGAAGSASFALVALGFFGLLTLLMDVGCWKYDSELPVPQRWSSTVRGIAYGFILLLILTIGEPNGQPFIYFQF